MFQPSTYSLTIRKRRMPPQPTTSTDVVLEEATDLQDLEALRSEWAGLWARCPTATPFQSPAWLIPWWQCLGRGDLWTLALRHDDRLVGLAPLFIYPETRGSFARTVRVLGTGNTDYLDVLVEPDFEAVGLASFFRHLDRHRERWDGCDFQHLRADSPLLDAPVPARWSDEVTVQEACPVLTLPERIEEQRERIPAGFLKKLRYYRRRAEREGTVAFESACEENLERLFGAFLRIHSARWAEQDESSVLAGDAVRRFHACAIGALLDSNRLRLYALRLDGQIVASYYGFTHRKRHYYYLGGFDPAFSRLSLGHQIVHHAMREAIREGVHTFDFLRGQEPYKYRWGAEDRLNRRRRIRHTPRSTGG